jgi:pimeloyl-ACP methyl ester carboxylesterase
MRIGAILATLIVLAGAASAKPMPGDKNAADHCPKDAACGSVLRPLDPTGQVKGKIAVFYRFYPHLDSGKPAAGTIVAQEGGPGFPTFKSAYGYLQLFAPLRADHDVVMVDARGTGKSGAIDCPSVQRSDVRKPADVGACGRRLGAAADLYGTRLAAEDMAAVLDALHIGKVDFYGDSYGTFFGQVFSALYPGRLRSVVLDGAYPVIGETPWYSNAGAVVRKGFDAACQRAPYCAALPGTSLDRIRELVEYVRKTPISGRAPDGEGEMRDATADPSSIGNLLYAGVSGPVNYRDLDAAIRAWFDNKDARPLLRLVAENDANEDPTPPLTYSYGLFSAVSCMDYQQVYDMTSPIPRRHAERLAALEAERGSNPKVYDPLTIAEFQTVPIDISVLNLCIDWPIHQPPYTPGLPIPKNAKFTQAPTLVMNGELDMLTTAAEGAIVTAQYPHGRQVIVANSFHVDAIDDYDDCASEIVRRFVETLDAGDTSCAANVNAVRLVPIFVRKAADAIAAQVASGNAASARELAFASAAVQTAGDALARWNINYSGHGVGLRGGHWSYRQPDLVARYALDGVRWAGDLAVSGTAAWDQRDGAIRAVLTFTDPDGGAARLVARWNDRDHDAVATLSGRIGGHRLEATMPAP